MTKFADQLLADLVREHGPALALSGPPAPRRHGASRRTLLATGAGFAAAGATAGALMASGVMSGGVVAGGGGATPAYALTTHANGTVTLDVYRESGIAGINVKLHQLGDGQVVVVPVEPGCPSPGSLPAPAVSPAGTRVTVVSGRSIDGSVTVDAQGIPAGDILVVGFATTATESYGGSFLTSPPAPSCISLPAPPPPGTGGSGPGTVSGGGSGSGQTVTSSG
jgi:hypothetical protein